MSEVVVPLLDLPALGKTPSGKLPSKADFLCLLWGSVGGNFVGFQGKIYFNQTLLNSFASQELQVSAARSALVARREAVLSSNIHAYSSSWRKTGRKLALPCSRIRTSCRWWKKQSRSLTRWRSVASSPSRTTFNLAAADWRDKVNQDRRLRADWRKEKLAFMDDFIGSEATR